MKKDIALSVLRSILTAVGAYLVGKSFLGATIDDNLWMGVIGAATTVVSVTWGVLDKTATLEAVQSGVRSVIIFIGALLVGSGVLKEQVLESTLAIVSTILPVIYSQISKVKSKDIANGELGVSDLKGVDENEMAVQPKANTPDK